MTAHNVLYLPRLYGKTYAAVSSLLSHPDSQMIVATGAERRRILDEIRGRLGDEAFDLFDMTRVALPEPHRLRDSKYPRVIVDNADIVLAILLQLPAHAEFELLTFDQADRS